MKRQIFDDLTELLEKGLMSRQQAYQIRKKRDRKCTICGKGIVTAFYCLEHAIKERERRRARMGQKRRNLNSLTYRLKV